MSRPERSPRRRRTAVAGVVGLAAVLGGGAFLMTDHLTDEPAAVTADAGASAPLEPPADGAPPAATADSPSPGPARTPAGAKAAPSPAPAATTAKPRPRTTAEIIDALKGAAAKATDNVKRAPVGPGAPLSDADVKVTESGAPSDAAGMLRVVSAAGNLAGQRELGWVSGLKGEKVGAARCSQTIRLSPNAPARERPTLLLCWRTSATKSVYTLAVNHHKRPSKQASVAALTRAWNQL
ncbi:hypothetical protein [Jidongwangia harbinensis]|uniref:hypothetical protein n=1 Tax=Jidongwangia harbinensis TaxID=2878561 RepID=UPI001CD93281|nr:hypothetical protein [Jidongwangia harbinensis]MCA2215927.1 hypothetical protein [Jidongwangia harbinensis]